MSGLAANRAYKDIFNIPNYNDDVKRAETILRRVYANVFNSVVTGGLTSHWFVEEKLVSRDQLLQMAEDVINSEEYPAGLVPLSS